MMMIDIPDINDVDDDGDFINDILILVTSHLLDSDQQEVQTTIQMDVKMIQKTMMMIMTCSMTLWIAVQRA